MLDFQIPRITSEQVEDNRGSFAIEALDRAVRPSPPAGLNHER